MKKKHFLNIKLVIMDLDGTVYAQGGLRDGFVNFMNNLKHRHIKTIFYTNTCVKSKERVLKKMNRLMDCYINENAVYTSTDACVQYLKSISYTKSQNIYVNCENDYLKDTLINNGYNAISNIDDIRDVSIDMYIQGSNQAFNYQDLLVAYDLIKNKGALFCATDNESLYITQKGVLKPATGWIISSITKCTNIKPTVLGKPNGILLKNLLIMNNIKPTEVLVIGDSIESDIPLGKANGCYSCLMLEGVTSMLNVIQDKHEYMPDFITNNFTDILRNF